MVLICIVADLEISIFLSPSLPSFLPSFYSPIGELTRLLSLGLSILHAVSHSFLLLFCQSTFSPTPFVPFSILMPYCCLCHLETSDADSAQSKDDWNENLEFLMSSADCLLGQILFCAAGHLENFPSCLSRYRCRRDNFRVSPIL